MKTLWVISKIAVLNKIKSLHTRLLQCIRSLSLGQWGLLVVLFIFLVAMATVTYLRCENKNLFFDLTISRFLEILSLVFVVMVLTHRNDKKMRRYELLNKDLEIIESIYLDIRDKLLNIKKIEENDLLTSLPYSTLIHDLKRAFMFLKQIKEVLEADKIKNINKLFENIENNHREIRAIVNTKIDPPDMVALYSGGNKRALFINSLCGHTSNILGNLNKIRLKLYE